MFLKENFKNSNEHFHEVDVIIQLEKGSATSMGRYSTVGKIEIM